MRLKTLVAFPPAEKSPAALNRTVGSPGADATGPASTVRSTAVASATRRNRPVMARN